MTKEKKKQILVVAIILLLCVGIAVAIFFAVREERRRAALNEQFLLETNELRARRNALTIELSGLEKTLIKELGCSVAISILVTDLPETEVNDIYQKMSKEERRMVGILGLSPDELPGLPGKLSRTMYNQIIGSGWDTCLVFECDEDGKEETLVYLREWLDLMQDKLSELDIPFPKQIFFSDSYSSDFDSLLEEYGITSAMHRGDSGFPFIERENPEGMWHPGVLGWNTSKTANFMLQAALNSGGYFVYVTGTAEKGTDSLYPTISDGIANNEDAALASFVRMLNTFASYVAKDELKVLTVEDAMTFRKEYLVEYDYQMNVVLKERTAELQAEIGEIDAEIAKIRERYE